MFGAIKGFAGNQFSRVSTSVVGGLNQTLALEMSKKAPLDLYGLCDTLEHNPNQAGLVSFRQRLSTIGQKPQYKYLTSKFEEWTLKLDQIDDESLLVTLENIKLDIEETIQKNTSVPEHLLKKLSDFLESKLSLAPFVLRQARRLVTDVTLNKKVSSEILKKSLLEIITNVELNEEESLFLTSSIEKLEELSEKDWKLFLNFLKKKESEYSGPLTQHIHEIETEFLFLIECIGNQLSTQVEDVLKTPPFAISKSIFLINRLKHSTNKNTCCQLKELLLKCSTEQSWTSSEKIKIEEAIQSLDQPDATFDWQNILVILESKKSVLSGKLVENAHHFKNEFLELAEQLLKVLSTSLFRQGNPIRAQLDFCICYLRRATFDPSVELTDQKFLDYLDQLIHRLSFIQNKDDLFHQLRTRLNEIILTSKNTSFCENRFSQELLEVCEALLPFFEDSGTVVKIFETFQSVFQGTKISWSHPAKHIAVLPHTYSSNRLLDIGEEAGPCTPSHHRSATPSEWSVLRQALPTSKQDPYLKDLQVALQKYLKLLKGDLFTTLSQSLNIGEKNSPDQKSCFKFLKEDLSSDPGAGSYSPKQPLKHLLIVRYEHLFSKISDLILNCWLPNLHLSILSIVDPQKDALTVEPLEKLTTTFRQFSIDLDHFSQHISPQNRDKFLKNRRTKRQRSVSNYFHTGWSSSNFLAKKFSEHFSLSSVLSCILDKSVIPFDQALDHSLVRPFVKLFDFALKGFIHFTSRILLTLIPYEKITGKFLDKFITSDFLHRMYRSLLELFLEDYRSKLENGFNTDLGHRVDPDTAKEFLMSLTEVFEKSKGMDPKGLKNSYLQKIPTPIRLNFYDLASKGVQTAWENLLSPSSVNKTFDSITAALEKKSQQHNGELVEPILIGMSDQDLEHALARHLVNDLFAKKNTLPLEAHFEQLRQFILDLPSPQKRDAFIPAFNILKKAMADGLEKIDPVIVGRSAEILSRKMREIECNLLKGSTNLEELIEDLRQSVHHLRFESSIDQDFRFKDMILPWLHKTIETVLISIREIMTDKELIKRILLDQLYPK